MKDLVRGRSWRRFQKLKAKYKWIRVFKLVKRSWYKNEMYVNPSFEYIHPSNVRNAPPILKRFWRFEWLVRDSNPNCETKLDWRKKTRAFNANAWLKLRYLTVDELNEQFQQFKHNRISDIYDWY